MVGAITTVILLLIYVPIYGFKAAAYTTLVAYFLMTIISYFIGKYYYPINYNIKKILVLLITAVGMYLLSDFMILSGLKSVLANLLFIGAYISIGFRMNLRRRKE